MLDDGKSLHFNNLGDEQKPKTTKDCSPKLAVGAYFVKQISKAYFMQTAQNLVKWLSKYMRIKRLDKKILVEANKTWCLRCK